MDAASEKTNTKRNINATAIGIIFFIVSPPSEHCVLNTIRPFGEHRIRTTTQKTPSVFSRDLYSNDRRAPASLMRLYRSILETNLAPEFTGTRHAVEIVMAAARDAAACVNLPVLGRTMCICRDHTTPQALTTPGLDIRRGGRGQREYEHKEKQQGERRRKIPLHAITPSQNVRISRSRLTALGS